MTMDLQQLRMAIDEIDGDLVALIERRMELARQVADYKRQNHLPILDAGREQVVVERAESRTGDPALRPAVRRIVESLMAESRLLQQDLLADGPTPNPAPNGAVAYLGPAGSFSHEAALRYFGAGAALLPVSSFEAIAQDVATGRAAAGLLPVENTLTGAIHQAGDLLRGGSLHICGEVVLPVRHCLLALPGATMEEITTVLSHPQPLEQCAGTLKRLGVVTQARASTADAAREVAQLGERTLAAIGSAQAGALYGLEPLAKDIQDNSANYTRFAVVAAGEAVPQPDADKISIVFAVEHRPGTLYGTLRAFADRGVNILNLVSRPIAGAPWQYSFHMDFEGHLGERKVDEALAEAARHCRSLTVLGNYRGWPQ